MLYYWLWIRLELHCLKANLNISYFKCYVHKLKILFDLYSVLWQHVVCCQSNREDRAYLGMDKSQLGLQPGAVSPHLLTAAGSVKNPQRAT